LSGLIWVLELHLEGRVPNSLIMRREFISLPALRIAIMENPGRRFIVIPPVSMTAGDRTALLNMRADGIDIEMMGTSPW
jgi:hypothetical protein